MVQADQHLGLRAVEGVGWGASRCWICVKMKYGSLQWGRWRARRQKQSILSSVQLLSRVQLLATLRTAACQASLFIINFWSLLRLMPTEVVMPFNHLTLCRPFLLPPSIFPSSRVFSNESILHIRGPKYWSFSFSISPCNEHSGLISFRIDWLNILAVQGTLKSLIQHHSSKASILQHSAFRKLRSWHPVPSLHGK